MKRALTSLVPILVGVITGCVVDADENDIASTNSEIIAVPCNDVSGTVVGRSLAITNPTVLSHFSFRRVMDRLRVSANVDTAETTLALYQSWMKTWGSTAAVGDCNDPTVDPNRYGLQCPRPDEARLATINPFATAAKLSFEPVALFNRFDLAPSNGAHCGEYRIVYALRSAPDAPFSGRAFIIFEGALANPTPSKGIDACLPVAQFWQGLSKISDSDVLASKLDRFYFTGGAVTGFAEPVVQATSYGLHAAGGAPTAGQIRTNFFMGPEWHLREFKLRRACSDPNVASTCKLDFHHVPAAANPANEVFGSGHARSAAFHTAFPNQVRLLAAPDVPRIRMVTTSAYNELESVSQRTDVVYASFADTPMRSSIQAKLTELGSKLTVNNILDRATSQTCAGCHLLSAGRNLGGGQVFPGNLGFVHVDEGRNLSPALTDVFLPHRKRVLESFINARCTGTTSATAAADDTTVGGSAAGAPN